MMARLSQSVQTAAKMQPNSAAAQGGMMGNPMQMIRQFAEFKKLLGGRNPQQMVQKLLSTNQMTGQQFEQLQAMAKELQGILK